MDARILALILPILGISAVRMMDNVLATQKNMETDGQTRWYKKHGRTRTAFRNSVAMSNSKLISGICGATVGTHLPTIRRMGKGPNRRVTPKQHFPLWMQQGLVWGRTYHCGLALNLKTSVANPSTPTLVWWCSTWSSNVSAQILAITTLSSSGAVPLHQHRKPRLHHNCHCSHHCCAPPPILVFATVCFWTGSMHSSSRRICMPMPSRVPNSPLS